MCGGKSLAGAGAGFSERVESCSDAMDCFRAWVAGAGGGGAVLCAWDRLETYKLTQFVLARHSWSTNTNANTNKSATHESSHTSPIGLGLDLHVTASTASGSLVVEIHPMEQNNDSTRWASATPI